MKSIRPATIQWRTSEVFGGHLSTTRPHRISRPPSRYRTRHASTAAAAKESGESSESRREPKLKVGVAVSGGVDSMALAFLTKQSLSSRDKMRVFVVDHGLRTTSSEEAKQTKSNLRRMGIRGFVLKAPHLKTAVGEKSSRLETLARAERFRLLGKACREQGISELFLGHHRDDAYETALDRICRHATFNLGGHSEQNDIPENFKRYGVHQSGSPRDFKHRPDSLQSIGVQGFEDGGIKISKPLANLTKAELVAVCKVNNVPWIEDESNKDPTLTNRNAIRLCLTDDVLPKALQRESILSLRDRIHELWQKHKTLADHIFDMCQLRFHPAFGYLLINLVPLSTEFLQSLAEQKLGLNVPINNAFVVSMLITRLVEIVTPTQTVETFQAETLANEWIHKTKPARDFHTFQIGNVQVTNFQEQSDFKLFHPIDPQQNVWCFYRTPGARVNEDISAIRPEADANIMFDKRFWLTIANQSSFLVEISPAITRDADMLADLVDRQNFTLVVSTSMLNNPKEQVRFELKREEAQQRFSNLAPAQINLTKRWKKPKMRSILWSLGSFLTSAHIPALFITEADGNKHLFGFPTLGVVLKPPEDWGTPELRDAFSEIIVEARYKKVNWGAHEENLEKTVLIRTADSSKISQFIRWECEPWNAPSIPVPHQPVKTAKLPRKERLTRRQAATLIDASSRKRARIRKHDAKNSELPWSHHASQATDEITRFAPGRSHSTNLDTREVVTDTQTRTYETKVRRKIFSHQSNKKKSLRIMRVGALISHPKRAETQSNLSEARKKKQRVIPRTGENLLKYLRYGERRVSAGNTKALDPTPIAADATPKNED